MDLYNINTKNDTQNVKIRRYNKILSREDIYNNIFTSTYRFGYLNPYGTLSAGKEFVFFTKPDLNIMVNGSLNAGLQSPFWTDLANHRYPIVKSLQQSLDSSTPFIHLLQNTLISNVPIPSLSATNTDTAVNNYGISFTYRGSSESSDDMPDFSLEFKDDKYLNTYTFFRAYEEYETEKHHGTVVPNMNYVVNKILHDQFSLYKFIVDEDMETILYFGKYFGVMPTSLPRDTFSSDNFDSGISYTIDFKAAFYEDMKPEILSDFNALSMPSGLSTIPICESLYDNGLSYDRVSNAPVKGARVEVVSGNDERAKQNALGKQSSGIFYKLKWFG